MAGKGPLPKVAGERQRRNKRRKVKLVPQRDKAPPPRAKWLKQTKEAWAKYWTSPISDAVHRPTEGPAVRRWFALLDMRERAYRSYEDKPFISGSAGQEILNPQASLMLRMDQELRMLGQELGLSPAARLRLGIDTEDPEKGDDLSASWQADDLDDAKDPRLKVVK